MFARQGQCIHCKVTHKASQFWCYVSFIYASNASNEQTELWQDLEQLYVQGPWLLMGDYNVILNAEERVHESGNVRDPGSELETFMHTTGL